MAETLVMINEKINQQQKNRFFNFSILNFFFIFQMWFYLLAFYLLLKYQCIE